MSPATTLLIIWRTHSTRVHTRTPATGKQRNQLEPTGSNGLKLPVGQQISSQLLPRILLDAWITAKNDPMDPEAVLMLSQCDGGCDFEQAAITTERKAQGPGQHRKDTWPGLGNRPRFARETESKAAPRWPLWAHKMETISPISQGGWDCYI